MLLCWPIVTSWTVVSASITWPEYVHCRPTVNAKIVDEKRLDPSLVGQITSPIYLHVAVGRNGFVMVVDRWNSRLLLLDLDLKLRREILSKQFHGLQNPCKFLQIWYETERVLLRMGEFWRRITAYYYSMISRKKDTSIGNGNPVGWRVEEHEARDGGWVAVCWGIANVRNAKRSSYPSWCTAWGLNLLDNLRWLVNGGHGSVRLKADRVECGGWMLKG